MMASTAFPNFPHEIDSAEPEENWTVEHVLQWHLLKSHEVTDVKHEELVASLRTQLDVGKMELLHLHEQQQLQQQENINNRVSVANGTGVGKLLTNNTTTTSTTATTTSSSSQLKHRQQKLGTVAGGKLTTIQIIVIGGPHASPHQVYHLQPKSNAPCMVGRSAGKKFRDKGVSLSKDSEVSTTHGKFEFRKAAAGAATKNAAYFTDVGSTNGTTYQNVLLEPNDAFLLKENMVLILGGTTIQITGLL